MIHSLFLPRENTLPRLTRSPLPAPSPFQKSTQAGSTRVPPCQGRTQTGWHPIPKSVNRLLEPDKLHWQRQGLVVPVYLQLFPLVFTRERRQPHQEKRREGQQQQQQARRTRKGLHFIPCSGCGYHSQQNSRKCAAAALQ